MSNKNKNLKGVVYSTNPDFKYEQKEDPGSETPPNKQQNLHVRIERNHRGGKSVTLVDGFVGASNDLEELGKTLRIKCGVGGSVKDSQILIQGEQKERVVKLLLEMGYKAK